MKIELSMTETCYLYELVVRDLSERSKKIPHGEWESLRDRLYDGYIEAQMLEAIATRKRERDMAIEKAVTYGVRCD